MVYRSDVRIIFLLCHRNDTGIGRYWNRLVFVMARDVRPLHRSAALIRDGQFRLDGKDEVHKEEKRSGNCRLVSLRHRRQISAEHRIKHNTARAGEVAVEDIRLAQTEDELTHFLILKGELSSVNDGGWALLLPGKLAPRQRPVNVDGPRGSTIVSACDDQPAADARIPGRAGQTPRKDR